MNEPDFFFLSPVQVMKVTKENMKEVAEWCGGLVAETESRRVQGRMDQYVSVPTPKNAAVAWAFPGMFVTKRLVITMKGELKATWAVFRRDYFEKNYFDSPKAATDATWEREHDEALKPKHEEVVVNVSVGDALKDAHAIAEIRKIAAAGGNVTINVTQEQPFSAPTNGQALTIPPGELPQIVHNHLMDEKCDEAGCEADRYLDGMHYFTDKTVVARPGEENVVTDNEIAVEDLSGSLT